VFGEPPGKKLFNHFQPPINPKNTFIPQINAHIIQGHGDRSSGTLNARIPVMTAIEKLTACRISILFFLS
jgi:hypothetical protein